MIIFEFIVAVMFLVLAYRSPQLLFKKFLLNKRLTSSLFLYHLLFTLYYYYVLISDGGDALVYWFCMFPDFNFDDVIEMLQKSSKGFLLLLNYYPKQILNFSVLTGCIMYSCVGYLGLVLLLKVVEETSVEIEKVKGYRILGIPVYPWIFFLPNIHLWSSSIGKDSLMFFSIFALAYSMLNIRKRLVLFIIASIVAFYVRPHILLFLYISLSLGYLLDARIKFSTKLLLVLIVLGGFSNFLNYVLDFAQIESFNEEAITSFAEGKVENLSRGRGSAVALSSYPYPLKIVTFLYRPLFFDGLGVLGLLASFENLFLLFFSVIVLRSSPYKGFRDSSAVIKALTVFFLIGTLAFSLILGNLGIMSRVKAPFICCLILFGFWSLGRVKSI